MQYLIFTLRKIFSVALNMAFSKSQCNIFGIIYILLYLLEFLFISSNNIS